MLEFNEELHEYKKDGLRVPSVTQIIAANGLSDFSGVPEKILAYAVALGNAVHRASELWEACELDPCTVDGPVQARLDQWVQAICTLTKAGVTVGDRLIEQRMYSRLGFAGTPDRVYIHNQTAAIIDLKTGVKTAAAPVQTAGYKILVQEAFPKIRHWKRVAVYLKDGGFALETHHDEADEIVFKSCLNLYTYKQKRGIL